MHIYRPPGCLHVATILVPKSIQQDARCKSKKQEQEVKWDFGLGARGRSVNRSASSRTRHFLAAASYRSSETYEPRGENTVPPQTSHTLHTLHTLQDNVVVSPRVVSLSPNIRHSPPHTVHQTVIAGGCAAVAGRFHPAPFEQTVLKKGGKNLEKTAR